MARSVLIRFASIKGLVRGPKELKEISYREFLP
jgi:hypothetical protein